MVLVKGPPGTCGTMAALLAPSTDRPVHAVAELAYLGDVEVDALAGLPTQEKSQWRAGR